MLSRLREFWHRGIGAKLIVIGVASTVSVATFLVLCCAAILLIPTPRQALPTPVAQFATVAPGAAIVPTKAPTATIAPTAAPSRTPAPTETPAVPTDAPQPTAAPAAPP